MSAWFKNGFIVVNFENEICGVLCRYNLTFCVFSDCVQRMHTIFFFNFLKHALLVPQLMEDGLHAPQISDVSQLHIYCPAFGLIYED
jgi:hypothetical protein